MRLAALLLAGALLAGCAGVTPAQPRLQNAAWMRSEAKVTICSMPHTGVEASAYLSYPSLAEVGSIQIDSGAAGNLCSDKDGNVFVLSYLSGGTIYEYAHGGTMPVATLSVYPYGGNPVGCSIDPWSGDLAVVSSDPVHGNTIDVFAGAQGTPMSYPTGSKLATVDSCAYDTAGNLYVDGSDSARHFLFAELPNGGNSLSWISGPVLKSWGHLQWVDGKMTVEGPASPPVLYTIKIAASKLEVQKTTSFDPDEAHVLASSWIYKGVIAVPFAHLGRNFHIVGIWSYPPGGESIKRSNTLDGVRAVTVSVTPRAF